MRKVVALLAVGLSLVVASTVGVSKAAAYTYQCTYRSGNGQVTGYTFGYQNAANTWPSAGHSISSGVQLDGAYIGSPTYPPIQQEGGMVGIDSSVAQLEAGIDITNDPFYGGPTPYLFVEAYNPTNTAALQAAGWYNEAAPSLYWAYSWSPPDGFVYGTNYTPFKLVHDTGTVGGGSTWHLVGPSGTPAAASASVSFGGGSSNDEYYQNESRVGATSECPRGAYNFPGLSGFASLSWNDIGADPQFMFHGSAKYGQYIEFPYVECFNCQIPVGGTSTPASLLQGSNPQVISPIHQH